MSDGALRRRGDSFAGQTVLITGGSRGIGEALVWAFAAEGAQVAFCYRSNAEAANALCHRAQAEGLSVQGYRADVAELAEVEALVSQVVKDFGRIDVLVNNAGIFRKQSVAEMEAELWDAVLRSNLYSVYYCCRAVLPHMIRQGGGRIVNMASVAGKRGSAYHAHYAAAKGGVLAFTRSLAREVIGQGIRVNAICPGRIDTEMLQADAGAGDAVRWQADTPIQRLGTAAEVAAATLFLASAASSYVVGETLDVDGGLLMD